MTHFTNPILHPAFRAAGIFLVFCRAGASPAEAYSGIALLAAACDNGLIIETRPEQESAWTNLVQAVRPDMPILLCTVKAPRQ